jgi:hypothetical protein
MLSLVSVCAAGLVLASLPSWLPRTIVALRMRIFTRINGDEGVAIPGPLVDASRFIQVYADAAARGRSRGAALSDLFWYWLSPGPEMHQEHIEDGPRYEEVARATRRMLALSRTQAEALTAQCVGRVVAPLEAARPRVVRLRDWMMPVWAEFYYELVFGEPCPPAARSLIVDNANDVVTALKCTGLRHMATRDRLTRFLIRKLRDGEMPHALPEQLSIEERALYLQGVFFNTAIVQTSEAMVHILMVLAQHEQVQADVAAHPEDDHALERVIDETLRMFPLFGISHRITSADIAVDPHTTIPKGAVLCFNHLDYHRARFDDPDRFDPDRWLTRSARDTNYIPYGVPANRPCPASGLAPITLRVATREILSRFVLRSSASHTRSIPNRGPCLLVPRARGDDPGRQRAILHAMRVRDRWEDVSRSVVQLLFGTYMVWHARRLRLCARHFDGSVGDAACSDERTSASGCPMTASGNGRARAR